MGQQKVNNMQKIILELRLQLMVVENIDGLLADEYKNDQLKKKCFVVRYFTNLFLTFILLWTWGHCGKAVMSRAVFSEAWRVRSVP